MKDRITKKPHAPQVLLRLLVLVRPLAAFMLLSVTAGTLGYLCAGFIPVHGGFALLHHHGYAIPASITAVHVLLITFALVRAVLRYTEQRTNHYIAFTLLAIIRDRVFGALRRLCPAKLDGRSKGDLIALITSDVEQLEVFYAHTISPICIAFVTELIMCLFIGSWHWSLGVLALTAYLCVGILLPVIIYRRSGSLGDELRAQNAQLSSYMLENIRGLDETIQYHTGEQRMDTMTAQTKALSARQGEQNRLTGVNQALANTFVLFFDAAMLLLCTVLYRNGIIGFDAFLIPQLALISSFGPVIALANLGTALQTTVASGARVLSILDEAPAVEDITGAPNVAFNGAAADRISFSYRTDEGKNAMQYKGAETNKTENKEKSSTTSISADRKTGREKVLDNFSISLPRGRIIGIVGKSGCGKSTLLRLLMRFWQTDAGTISISGKNINEINTKNLRDMQSFMTQDTHLFRDTIAGNLRIAKPDATQAELEQACKKASIHDFIMTLPKGYETPVGELGETLSGGERQRIGLARAFLHDAPFMLLDEPTSNLDSLNEAIILKSLKEASEGRTIALVSHRTSTVRIADEVVAM